MSRAALPPDGDERIDNVDACLQNACMPNILIRNVPEDLHARLVADARAHGRSLQQHLLAVLSGRQAPWSSSEAVGQIMQLGQRLRQDGYVSDWGFEDPVDLARG